MQTCRQSEIWDSGDLQWHDKNELKRLDRWILDTAGAEFSWALSVFKSISATTVAPKNIVPGSLAVLCLISTNLAPCISSLWRELSATVNPECCPLLPHTRQLYSCVSKRWLPLRLFAVVMSIRRCCSILFTPVCCQHKRRLQIAVSTLVISILNFVAIQWVMNEESMDRRSWLMRIQPFCLSCPPYDWDDPNLTSIFSFFFGGPSHQMILLDWWIHVSFELKLIDWPPDFPAKRTGTFPFP